MDNNMVNALTPHLIGKRPNTYTFTKSLAEHVLLQEADNFPIAIFRPSIIGAAYKEPFEVSFSYNNSQYSHGQWDHASSDRGTQCTLQCLIIIYFISAEDGCL